MSRPICSRNASREGNLSSSRSFSTKRGSRESATLYVTQLYKQVPVLDSGARAAATTFVQKKIESLPGRQLSLLVLRLETRLTTTQLGLGAPALQEVELLTHRHWSEKLTLCGIGI